MHVLQARSEFFLVSHKAIPKLVLPQRTLCTPPRVQPQRHDLFGVIQHLLDQQRILRPNQGVPVVGHQDIAAEQKSQPPPRSLQYGQEQIVFRFVESPDLRTKVDADEEDAVRVA